jgi:ferric-dicitrate binding protein FerR (iron transport regulator)
MALIKRTPEATDEACDQYLAQAAVWIACLHADHCSDADRQAFLTWLNECEAHRHAFARVADAWEIAGGLVSDVQPAAARTVLPASCPEARCCGDD